MLRKFKISVDGRSYSVIVEEESVTPLAHAGAPAAPPSGAVPAPPSAPAPAPAAPAAVAAGAGSVVAPLAGVMDSIDVRIGQVVNAGDKVAVLEAMKMKTEVFTKAAGTVQSISVKPGESVDTGQVILVIG